MPYQMMQTTARMKMKKYDPYMPITERARTGLIVISISSSIFVSSDNLQSNVVLGAWTGHEYDHNSSQKRPQTCRYERLLPGLDAISGPEQTHWYYFVDVQDQR